ncbi:MAG: hypothetical protein AAF481_13870 [Acidobacteriota bacterium]
MGLNRKKFPGARSFVFCLLLAGAVGSMSAPPAAAQMQQYTPPGGPDFRVVDPQAILEEQMAEARWRLGPLRLVPWFGLSQLGYVDDVFAGSTSEDESVSDFTAVVGAGLTGYLPTGPKVTWVFDVTPRYIWWQDLTERRQFAGRFGAGFFGYFNRLRLEATAGREETQRTFSPEFPQPTVLEEDHVRAHLGLRLSQKIEAFAEGEGRRTRDQSDEFADDRTPNFDALDRDEEMLRGGLRYRPTERSTIAIGVEDLTVDSTASARDLSNAGTSPFLELDFEGGRSRFGAEVVLRDLSGTGSSRFGTYDEVAGHLHGQMKIGWRLELRAYATTTPILSLLDEYSFFEQRRYGMGLGSEWGRRTFFEVFADRGDNRYNRVLPTTPERTDDFESLGAQLQFDLTESLSMTVRVEDSTYESSLPGADRDVFAVRTNVSLSTNRLLWR